MSYLERAIADGHAKQAVERSCGNGTWAKSRANYVGVVAGMTRRFFDFSGKYGVLEREASLIADLPRIYGKPEEYRFYQGDPNNDLQPVSKEALIGAIKKCHQTLWAVGKLSPPPAL
jgi:type I restriction enzyme M protein